MIQKIHRARNTEIWAEHTEITDSKAADGGFNVRFFTRTPHCIFSVSVAVVKVSGSISLGAADLVSKASMSAEIFVFQATQTRLRKLTHSFERSGLSLPEPTGNLADI